MRQILFPLILCFLASCAGADALRVRAQFNDTQGLRPGAPVQISGVRVGTVTAINPVSGTKELIIDFPKPAPPVPNDARVRLIRALGSGEYFVELDLAKTNGAPAKNNDLLPTETIEPTKR